MYTRYRNPSKTPEILLLESLDIALSPDKNECLTLSVLIFRLWAIYHMNEVEKIDRIYKCKLSQLVPLRNGQEGRLLTFNPWFSVRNTLNSITKENWKSFVQQVYKQQDENYKECIAYQNKGKAPFADSFILTEPPIFIQDKQSIVSRKKQIIGDIPKAITKDLMKDEHEKCNIIGDHIFILVTDEKKRDDIDNKLKNNEVLISSENMKEVFGDILALRKLYCIERA